jgi:hypothetical protein
LLDIIDGVIVEERLATLRWVSAKKERGHLYACACPQARRTLRHAPGVSEASLA